MRRLRFLVMLVLGLGVAAPLAAPEATRTADAATVARTKIRYYLPYTVDGLASGPAVADTVSGQCMVPSLAAVGRPDARTCIAVDSNELRDPCFE